MMSVCNHTDISYEHEWDGHKTYRYKFCKICAKEIY